MSWYNSDWTYRKKITIQASEVDDNMTDYPMLISVTDTDLRDEAQNDGDDILFTQSNGTSKLDHEIEYYDGTTGQLICWVEVNSVSSGSNTDIYMYYGNALIGAQQNITGTWNANFIVVHHMTGAAHTDLDDATSNNNDVTTEAGNPQYNQTGQVRYGVTFDDSDWVYTGTVAHGIGTGAFTFEVWTYPTVYDENYDCMISNGSYSPGFYAQLDAGGDFGFYWGGNLVSGETISTGGWTYAVGRRSGTTINYYKDGGVTGTSHTVSTSMSNAALWFNAEDGNGWANCHQTLDEIRISDTDRSAGWIRATFSNLNNPAGFYSVGSEETETPAAPAAVTRSLRRRYRPGKTSRITKRR